MIMVYDRTSLEVLYVRARFMLLRLFPLRFLILAIYFAFVVFLERLYIIYYPQL